MKYETQRDCFWDKVYTLAKKNRDIIIVSADMGAPALDIFKKELPGQFINTGVAEQNAMQIASGLALSGKKVYVYAIVSFIIMRCYEQIKLLLCNMNLPVTIVGVGAGYSYNDPHPSHHAIEDITLIRALPNITINNISDTAMASAFAEISLKMKGPNYVRLDRQKFPLIYGNSNKDFSKGLTVLRRGTDGYIVATGNMVHMALEAAKAVSKLDIDMGVIDLFTLPVNKKLLLSIMSSTKNVITLEEHTLNGGMGSAVIEVMVDNNIYKDKNIKRIGIDTKQGYIYQYGGRDSIQKAYGLDLGSILKVIRDFFKK